MKKKIIIVIVLCLFLAGIPLIAVLYMSSSEDTYTLIKDYSNQLMDYWIDIDVEEPKPIDVPTEISDLFLDEELLNKYLYWFSFNDDYTPITESYILQDTYDITGEVLQGDDFIALPFNTPGNGDRVYKVLVLNKRGKIVELKESLW